LLPIVARAAREIAFDLGRRKRVAYEPGARWEAAATEVF
jgi:hypothetical protein